MKIMYYLTYKWPTKYAIFHIYIVTATTPHSRHLRFNLCCGFIILNRIWFISFLLFFHYTVCSESNILPHIQTA